MASGMARDVEQIEAALTKEIVRSETSDFEIPGEFDFFQLMTAVAEF
jgi:hypothetical protein